jgi:hypothetical protein
MRHLYFFHSTRRTFFASSDRNSGKMSNAENHFLPFQSLKIDCTLLFCYNPAHARAGIRLHSQRRRGSGPARRSVSSVWRQLLTAPLRPCRYVHVPFSSLLASSIVCFVGQDKTHAPHPFPIITHAHTRTLESTRLPTHLPTHPPTHPQLLSPTLTFSHAKKETTRRTSSPSARRASSLPTTRLSGCFCTWLIKQYMLLERCADATFSCPPFPQPDNGRPRQPCSYST